MNVKLYVYPVTVAVGGGRRFVMNTIATCEEDAVKAALRYADSHHRLLRQTVAEEPCSTLLSVGKRYEATAYDQVLSWGAP